MIVGRDVIADVAAKVLKGTRLTPEEVVEIAWAAAWLESALYPGLKMLEEAIAETRPEDQTPALEPDAIGVDLRNISCAFTAPRIAVIAIERKRIFLRNVRHGLYLLPFSVRANIGIGCPVDPAFALGGERQRNPYKEKLSASEANGIIVDDALWARLAGQAKERSFS